jgi:hypothetical protein
VRKRHVVVLSEEERARRQGRLAVTCSSKTGAGPGRQPTLLP